MGITEEATRAAYAYAKKVYNGDIKRNKAIEYLATHQFEVAGFRETA